MNPSICVTIDYELYGDGSGSIEQHMVRPAYELLSFFASRKIAATFFIETAELITMEKAVRAGEGPRSLSTDLEAIRRQLSQIVVEGHDIQLHLHPQWHEAQWVQDTWILSSTHYRQLQWGEDVFKDLVMQGREYLEAIARPVRPDYECRIFRAGGFHFDRTERLGKILLQQGFRMDSSACRGYWRHTSYSSIDYRDLSGIRHPYWRTLDGGIGHGEQAMLWELPIWANLAPQWRKITARRLWGQLSRGRSQASLSHQFSQSGLGLNPLRVLGWLRQVQPLFWDFCLSSGRQLTKSFQSALRFHRPEGFFPLVMIGHTKHLQETSSLAEFHKTYPPGNDVEWITMSKALNKLPTI